MAALDRGRRAEKVIAEWLFARGWSVLDMNLRVGRYELDVVARRGDLIAVVEVRHRGAGAWQGGFESVDPAKAARVRMAGERLWRERFEHDPTVNRMRFDAATVTFDTDDRASVAYAEAVL